MPVPDLLVDGPADAVLTVALAHGAGAPMDSPFMRAFAEGLAARGHRAVRFEFPYMAERRRTGKRRGPDRAEVLLGTWRMVIQHLGPENLVIGGKSLGGRMASMVADETGVRGLACLGYPFHPPGRLDRVRVAHLNELRAPALILQGTRDPFGSPEQVEGYGLPPSIRVHWLDDGDHGFKPRKASGRTERGNWDEGIEVLSGFLAALTQGK
jgi:predicted alpha/beta-hydrolase family hydrolase